jgi:hypothetical protein
MKSAIIQNKNLVILAYRSSDIFKLNLLTFDGSYLSLSHYLKFLAAA